VQQDEEGLLASDLASVVGAENCTREVHPERPVEGRMPGVLRDLTAIGPDPREVLRPAVMQWPSIEVVALTERAVRPAKVEQLAREDLEIGLPRLPLPVVPGDLVVLAVGVVVAALSAPELVAAADHRDSGRQEQGRQQVAHLLVSDDIDDRVAGLALDAVVRGPVVVGAVAIPFEVRLVVLAVVRHKVAHRESIMRGDEVDRRERSTSLARVEVRRAGEPPAELSDGRATAPEVADVVAVLVVPLGPERWELPNLVSARADVPRLGDQLHAAQHRILLDRRHEVAEHVEVVERSRQGRGEVEAEAIDVHLLDPVAKGVHHQLEHVRLRHVEGVAATGVVRVVPTACLQVVVVVVVDAAKAQRRAELVALGRVVVDHVEDDLESSGVHRLDHALELRHLTSARARGGVAGVGREVADGIVAPVVGESELEQVNLVDELVHRQQLDRRDTERREVLEHLRMSEPGIGSALMLGYRRMQFRDATNVGLVDDGVAPGRPGGAVVAPVERVIDDDAARHERRRIRRVHDEVVAADVAVDRRIEPELPVDRLRVGIEEQLVVVPPLAPARVPLARNAEAVARSGGQVGDVAVIDVEDPLDQRYAVLIAAIVEDAELDGVR